MKNMFMSVVILMFMSSVVYAQDLSKDETCIYNSEYFKKIQVQDGSLKNAKNLSIDINALENDDFEVKFSVNKYFKPFVIMGAKISEFLSGFSLNDLGLGIGANIHMNESLSYYAKYSSTTLEGERLATINSEAMYLGIEYKF